ncbi:hypothetical protein AB0870_08080 [Microbacterium proteolyticum]|uniref:hypothetical protein n=1 Tax=Microbacterium proteolyticum TaxID=1572644 RepID=UPI0024176F51|nr:hypothetical protein [Microbacterium proteolyticum]
MIATWGDINAFSALCEVAGLTVPPTIVEAQRLREVAIGHAAEPPAKFLGIGDDELRDWLDRVTIRRLSSGFEPALAPFDALILLEVQREIGPELEALIEQMRGRFDEVAKPFVAAVRKHGFTARTTSDEMIRRGDTAAITAWRGTETFYRQIQPIAAVRQQLSRVFAVSPTAAEQGVYNDDAVDYSVCFAEGDGWSDNGSFYLSHHIGGNLDWFALAAGGLRLNSPDDVRRKIRARAQANTEGTD